MVVFKVATDIDRSLVTSFRPGNIIQLQTVSFLQGENLKVCNEISPVYLKLHSNIQQQYNNYVHHSVFTHYKISHNFHKQIISSLMYKH